MPLRTDARSDHLGDRVRCGAVPKSQIAYLVERVRAVVEVLKTPEESWNAEDLSDVCLEAAAFLREALGVPALERELASRSQIDIATLSEVTSWFAAVEQEAPRQYGMTFPDGTTYDWPGRIERLQTLIGGITQSEGLEEIEVVLRLGLVGDAAFASMLMALDADHPLRARLEQKLAEKLGLLQDDQALAFWAGLRREVDPSSEWSIALDPAVAPSDFFDLGDATSARTKISAYLARVRPLLVRKMFEKGNTTVPAGNLGIASILAWTARPSTRTWSPTDRAMIRALCRFVSCWRHVRGGDRLTELAEALGVQVGGYFIGGRGEQEANGPSTRRATSYPPQIAC